MNIRACTYMHARVGECINSTGNGTCDYQNLGTCIPELKRTEWQKINVTSNGNTITRLDGLTAQMGNMSSIFRRSYFRNSR